MKPKDILTLIIAKLKTHKLRTTITIIAASILFGTVIAALFIAKGFTNTLTTQAKTLFNDEIVLSVDYRPNNSYSTEAQQKALELYTQSTDQPKQSPLITLEDPDLTDGHISTPYLDPTNPFTIAAIATLNNSQNQLAKTTVQKLASRFDGEVRSANNSHCISGSLSIGGFPTSSPTASDSVTPNTPTTCLTDSPESLVSLDSNFLSPFIKLPQQKDGLIQVLAPLNQAAKTLGIKTPKSTDPNPATNLQEYVNAVNQHAIGHKFTGIFTDNEGSTSNLTFEIVGLLPSSDLSTLDPDTTNLLDTTLRNIMEYNGNTAQQSFIVTNPNSSTFRSHYSLDQSKTNSTVLVSFSTTKDAAAFIDYLRTRPQTNAHISASEFQGTRLAIEDTINFTDQGVIIFVAIFSLVSIIVIANTLSHTVDDKHFNISSPTANTHHVFAGYIFTVSLLIIGAATIISLLLVAFVTIVNTALISANISALYNIPNLPSVIFIGFDLRIFLIYIIIILIAPLCLLFALSKLTKKTSPQTSNPTPQNCP